MHLRIELKYLKDKVEVDSYVYWISSIEVEAIAYKKVINAVLQELGQWNETSREWMQNAKKRNKWVQRILEAMKMN